MAGALSSDPERARASAGDLGIAPDRVYVDFREMARAEAGREDGIDAVSIVRPNHMYADPAIAFLEAGIHVICDKRATVAVARKLVVVLHAMWRSGLPFDAGEAARVAA